MFWHYFKPSLNGYGVCAAMCLRCMAASMSVALCPSRVSCDWDTVFGSYLIKENPLKPIRQCPIISDFMLRVSKFALFTCCREMQVEIDVVNSNDNNFVNILVLTTRLKITKQRKAKYSWS